METSDSCTVKEIKVCILKTFRLYHLNAISAWFLTQQNHQQPFVELRNFPWVWIGESWDYVWETKLDTTDIKGDTDDI